MQIKRKDFKNPINYYLLIGALLLLKWLFFREC